jgi:LmbE family N-acetylglucosaminyl deacetylase
MDGVELLDVIKCLEIHIQTFEPTIVYTHHAGDLNIDHQITHKAAATACRPYPGQTVEGLIFFEVPSSTEWQIPSSSQAFAPNWFVDITDYLEQKKKALSPYSAEIRPWPHARSIDAVENLALVRGSATGVKAAEAFILGRLVR